MPEANTDPYTYRTCGRSKNLYTLQLKLLWILERHTNISLFITSFGMTMSGHPN